jgi:hypothetical protein
MKRLRGKLTYSNVISTLCLVLLFGGGTAYAASQLEKESVGASQLKKGAVTPAKLSKASKRTLTGPNGATGATGAQGPKGDKGEPGPLVETLPTGKTERGAWGFAGTRNGSGYYGGTTVSFSIPLANEPVPNIVTAGGPSTAACPGSAADPVATPGNLCLYGASETYPVEIVTISGGGGLKFGFLYLIEAAASANYEDYGTWAVTAG